jgi:hypothetical protein
MINLNRKKTVFFCCLMICFTALSGRSAMAAQDETPVTGSQTTPAHVYVELKRVLQLIDVMGHFMGVPEPDPLGIRISNASPHDVYFQARTLTIKANRLSFELIRKNKLLPVLAAGTIRPAQVKQMFFEAFGVLSEVALEFDMVAVNPEIQFDKTMTPSHVFMTTLMANRYLNVLLERRFSPAEVYKVVNLAIGYASRLVAQYPGAERIPKKPLYETKKKPLDVYYKLLDCFGLIKKIYKSDGYDILEIDISGLHKTNVSPSDVFDMASLIVARLDFLHKKNSLRRSPRESYFPGRKFPSDVYQQVGILEKQLANLFSYIEKKKEIDK